MTGDYVVQIVLLCHLQQRGKAHGSVAVDAGIGRAAGFVDTDKLVNDPLPEGPGEVHDLIGHIQLEGHLLGVLNVLGRTAGGELSQTAARLAVLPHGDAHAAVALLLHQIGGDRAVNAAAHGDEGAGGMFHLRQLLS